MKYVEVVANAGSADTIKAISVKVDAHDFRLGLVGDDNMQQMRMLVSDDKVQWVIDASQNVLGAQPTARILVLAIEASLPRMEESTRNPEKDSRTQTREALVEEVQKNAHLDLNFLLLVFLSTVVASIGLIENNVAVIIGAMVIAPLLAPNLALSLGTALGDINLVKKAINTLAVGILIAVALAVIIGFVWPVQIYSPEILSRTVVGWESIALALASGAAAALSLSTGLSSVLVGVMVAVALLPPAATLGIMLGQGNLHLALGAGLLLSVNIVCVNLASKLVFLAKGVNPRTLQAKEKAQKSMIVYVIGWLLTLFLLMLVIYLRGDY